MPLGPLKKGCELQTSKKQVPRDCGCRGLLSCRVASVASQNRSQVMLNWSNYYNWIDLFCD